MPDYLSALEQFARDLHQEVSLKAEDPEDPKMVEDAFTDVVMARLAEHNDVTGAELCYYNAQGRGRLPAAKVNGLAISGDAATLDLFVSLYDGGNAVKSVPKSEVNDHFKRLCGFLRRALDGFYTNLEESKDEFVAARGIYEAKDTLTTVRLLFLTDGIVNATEVESETISGLELRYELWDLEKLSRLRVGQREVIELDFARDHGGPIPCIATKDGVGEYTTYLAFLPARVLADIYGRYGQRLLERNVRAFLQAKGKVNRGLQQTLKEEPHRFLAYNNGLCCTAAEVRTEETGPGQVRLSWVKDLQIVNGGQTTASIFHAKRKEQINIEQVQVQVKLTVLAEPGKVIEIVPLISRYANSQNKVNTADFAANGRFHMNLEQLSRNVWTPPSGGLDRGSHWYYERARGSYLDDKAREGTPARIRDWIARNPLERKFTKTDIAKYDHAWLGLPHLVCRGAEKNFMAMAERHGEAGEPVVDENCFKQLVAKAILFKTAEHLFTELGLEGYRANAVAYAVAWLANRSGHRIDLDRIWERQAVLGATREAIKAACSAAHQHLLEMEGYSGTNVGEWSKRPECWETFSRSEIPVGDVWESDWAPHAYHSANTAGQALTLEWDRVRLALSQDVRTIEDLERYTGVTWLPSRRLHSVSQYANKSFQELRSEGIKVKRIRDLIQMFSAASRD